MLLLLPMLLLMPILLFRTVTLSANAAAKFTFSARESPLQMCSAVTEKHLMEFIFVVL